jgi:tRNA 2-thiocytidine biosynthesis protein TtcA
MMPSQTFFQDKFTLIRPLAFADAGLIRRFSRDQRFADFENPCPTAKISKRQEIKSLLKQLYRSNKKIKGNIFRAMSHVRLEYLLKS